MEKDKYGWIKNPLFGELPHGICPACGEQGAIVATSGKCSVCHMEDGEDDVPGATQQIIVYNASNYFPGVFYGWAEHELGDWFFSDLYYQTVYAKDISHWQPWEFVPKPEEFEKAASNKTR